ncbi:unnamed protein product, partial [Mesorhabditis belari]|uniref:Uncharacterized protein n=1 Tax=Mesorhabditis belari TaxID=2138241 RepID=A0AAF3FA37_9BILA
MLGTECTRKEDRVPDSPENVHVRTTAHSATLWWDQPSTSDRILVRGYAVSYGIGTPSSKIVIEGPNTNSFTIERLKPSTTYVFAVNAYNEADGEDGEKVLLTGKTLSDDDSKEKGAFSLWPPIAVRALAKERLVEVSWEDPNPERREENRVDGTGRHYIVQYGLYQTDHHEKLRVNGRNAKLVNLLPGREYEVAVKVIDGNGRESPWSIRDIVLTPQDQKAEISRYDWICGFEKDLCGMKTIGDTRWERIKGHLKANAGHYVMSINPSLSPSSHSSHLITPTFHMQKSHSLCVRFSIQMKEKEDNDAIFSVFLEDERTFRKEELIKIETEKMEKEKWIDFRLNLKGLRPAFKLVYELKWKHSAPMTSLDSLVLSSGVCGDKAGLRLPPYTTSNLKESTKCSLSGEMGLLGIW